MPNFASLLGPQALRDLQGHGRTVHFSGGDRLMGDRLAGDRVLLLEHGYVKIARVTPDGKDAVLDFRGPGELIGEQAALREGMRTATVEALTDGDALAISGAVFVAWLQSHPQGAMALLRGLSQRLSDADTQRVEYGASQTLARVAGRLLTLADRFGQRDNGRVDIALAISQEELAAWSGSSREATVKSLRTLRDLGVVETSRRRLVVLDTERLAGYAS